MNIHDMQFVYVGWGEVNQSCESGRGAKKGQDAERGQYRQWYLSSHKQTRAETLLQPPSPPPNDSVLLLILCISITSHFSLPFMRALIMLIQHSGSFFFSIAREAFTSEGNKNEKDCSFQLRFFISSRKDYSISVLPFDTLVERRTSYGASGDYYDLKYGYSWLPEDDS